MPLKREVAETQLKEFTEKNPEPKRIARIKKLPKAQATAAYGLLWRNAEGKLESDWRKRHATRKAADALLDKMSSAQRTKVFAAIFPNLAAEIEAAWNLCERLPYQSDYERRAFRTPNNPSLTLPTKSGLCTQLYSELAGFKDEVLTLPWLAAWAPYIGYGSSDAVGYLLAAGMEAGGKQADEIFDILKTSASGQHPIGVMGRHVCRSLLVVNRQDAWEFMEKLLIAAQRQEGLRQQILETVDESHPTAFRRMVALILKNDLVRFSSVVRAVDVWFGLQLEAVSAGQVKKVLQQVNTYLNDPKAVKKAIAGEDSTAAFYALIVAAFDDAEEAAVLAAKLTRDKNDPQRRLLGVHFLKMLSIGATIPHLLPLINDPDDKVAAFATKSLTDLENETVIAEVPNFFERLEKVIPRLPKAESTITLPGDRVEPLPTQEDIVDQLPFYRGDRPLNRLIPYLKLMNNYRCAHIIRELAEQKSIDDQCRALFFELVTDRSSDIREAALQAIIKCKPTPTEIESLEPLLARKNESLRRGVVSLILKQPQGMALASADRLLVSKAGPIRLAGLEVLRQLVSKKKGIEQAKARATTFQAAQKKISAEEQEHLDHILRERVSLDVGPHNAFGLCDFTGRTVPPKPKAKKVAFFTQTAAAILKALDALVHKHREKPVSVTTYEGTQELLLGTLGWRFPSVSYHKKTKAIEVEKLPLREIWTEFWDKRPKNLRDNDGFELVRAVAFESISEWDWRQFKAESRIASLKKLREVVFGNLEPFNLKYNEVVHEVLQWLAAIYPPSGLHTFALDGRETIYSHFTLESLRCDKKSIDRQSPEILDTWSSINSTALTPMTDDESHREFLLDLWFDQPNLGGALVRDRVSLSAILNAYVKGWANQQDLLDVLLGLPDDFVVKKDDDETMAQLLSSRYDALQSFTAKKPLEEFKSKPELAKLADDIRTRLLELEFARGEMPTPATRAVLAIGAFFGIDTFIQILAKLGDNSFKKGSRYTWNPSLDRTSVLTTLLKRTYPKPNETPEEFARAVNEAVQAGTVTLDPEQLLQLAFLAPHWLAFIEKLLAWEGLSEGVWWFLAHMPGYHAGVEDESEQSEDDEDGDDTDDEDGADSDDEDEADGGDETAEADDEEKNEDGEAGQPEQKLSAWERLIRQRTPLTQPERAEGAVDVSWFHRTFAIIGAKRWAELAAAAKFAGSGHEYKKPILLADVLLGNAKQEDIVLAISKKRLRESVRLIGLLPLSTGDARDKQLHQRYEVLQEYLKYARGLSSLSRPSALRAAEIGMANLARTAGFADPIRFEWEMEAQAVADLAAGPQSLTVDGVTVTLSLEDGKPNITVMRGDKPLKSIPPAVRKNEKIGDLTARKQHLTRQASRVKKSLEAMMCRGDEFTSNELRKLMLHPIIAPVLERLVIIGEGVAGYPVKGGQALENFDSKLEPLKTTEKLRIAHSTDLFATGAWDKWQRDLFTRERVQPFKQVFRELYVLTEQEKADGNTSHRYAGQQVQPRQGSALLNSRGWDTQDLTRTFHEAGIHVTFNIKFGGFTGLDVEGWTLEGIQFFRRESWKPMPLAEVPPRLFSEAMRDLDLIVSVAHVGGVDPEASASTVEMRSSLVRETFQLLRMANVRVDKNHVLIEGTLGQYSVHLGSGSVHKLPGGSVCIVPVTQQSRGRLFLPFADDDPRTAEVISKILMLARDNEIQDSTILQQLMA